MAQLKLISQLKREQKLLATNPELVHGLRRCDRVVRLLQALEKPIEIYARLRKEELRGYRRCRGGKCVLGIYIQKQFAKHLWKQGDLRVIVIAGSIELRWRKKIIRMYHQTDVMRRFISAFDSGRYPLLDMLYYPCGCSYTG